MTGKQFSRRRKASTQKKFKLFSLTNLRRQSITERNAKTINMEKHCPTRNLWGANEPVVSDRCARLRIGNWICHVTPERKEVWRNPHLSTFSHMTSLANHAVRIRKEMWKSEVKGKIVLKYDIQGTFLINNFLLPFPSEFSAFLSILRYPPPPATSANHFLCFFFWHFFPLFTPKIHLNIEASALSIHKGREKKGDEKRTKQKKV